MILIGRIILDLNQHCSYIFDKMNIQEKVHIGNMSVISVNSQKIASELLLHGFGHSEPTFHQLQ